MRLYAGTSQQFIQDTVQNQIAEKLRQAFFDHFHRDPSDNEIRSWKNSLRSISQVFQYANLLDHGVILEYQLPLSSKRLDCVISGKDKDGNDNAVIIELKQWDTCQNASSENEVLTWVAGAQREVLHPSAQVNQYRRYLADVHTAFNEGQHPVQLDACSYLHNYNYYEDDPIFSSDFTTLLQTCPLFTGDDVEELTDYLKQRLDGGEGRTVLQRIEESKYRPSKKLMQHVGEVIKGEPRYVLLDDQLVVYDKIFSLAKQGFHDKQKSVIIVKGGPGTGKSVIALNVMADLLLQGYNTHYATGSRAFTQTLRKVLGKRAEPQLKYFNSYLDAQPNEIDVLISDEAHRLRQYSHHRFIPKEKRTYDPQVEELIRTAKVPVFFIDDDQIVRPDEIGSVEHIREHAEGMGCQVFEYELETQFRCQGSDAFVNWVNNTLNIKRTANPI